MINNKLLTNQEKHWLSFMQTGDKEVDNILELQINNAVIKRHYDKYLIFIKFSIPSNIQKINIENGTPIELRVFRDSKPPVQMFLHIKDKYITELEIFSAYSSEISGLDAINNYKLFLDIKRLNENGNVSK